MKSEHFLRSGYIVSTLLFGPTQAHHLETKFNLLFLKWMSVNKHLFQMSRSGQDTKLRTEISLAKLITFLSVVLNKKRK